MPKPDRDESDESSFGKYGWKNPAPIWRRVIMFVCMLGACTFFAYTQASQFDETEIKLLALIAPILAGREILAAWKDARK